MQGEGRVENDVLSTPGHLISLAARGFARLSEARLKPLGFGVGHLPVLVALQDGQIGSQRDLARFARIEQPSMAQMLARKPRMLVAVALANKTARIVWALLAQGGIYRAPARAA